MNIKAFIASCSVAVMATAAAAQDPIVLKFGADSPTRGNVCTGYMDV